MKSRVLLRLGYYWAPVLAWMAVIFALSSLTQDQIEGPAREAPFFINEVTAHAGEYGVLAILLYRLLASYRLTPPWRIWLGVIAIAATYAVTDEVHQAFVPGREPSVADLAYDTLGALAGVVLAEAVVVFMRRLSRGD